MIGSMEIGISIIDNCPFLHMLCNIRWYGDFGALVEEYLFNILEDEMMEESYL